MIGLALEGGGTRGSYQIGAYLAFKKCGIKFAGYCGTSIGSFNAAMLAANQAKELLKFWQTVDVSGILGLEGFKTIEINSLHETFTNLKTVLKNKGINISKMRETLDQILDVEGLLKNKTDYGLVTFRLHDLKPVYKYKEEIPQDKFTDYILASCYLPVFKLEKIIDDNYYIDGGIYDNSPVNLLIKKDYQKIYVVKLNGFNRKQKPLKKCDITYIKPSRNLGSILGLNQEKIKENIQMGYFDTLKVIQNLDGYKFYFKSKPADYYKRLNKKVDKVLLKRVKKFWVSNDEKEITLKSLEFVLKQEKINYYHLYDVKKMLKKIKRKYQDKNFLYIYVKSLGKVSLWEEPTK